MKYMKRLLCFLLTFLLCFLTAAPALADQTALEISQGGKVYLPYGNQSGDGWSYSEKGTAKTLTLDNFQGGGITVGLDDEFQDKMTIILTDGTINKLHGLEAWIFLDTGKYSPVLKIQGKGKLIVWAEPPRVTSLKKTIQDAPGKIAKAEAELATAREELAKAQQEAVEAERTQKESEQRAREEAAEEQAATSSNSTPPTTKEMTISGQAIKEKTSSSGRNTIAIKPSGRSSGGSSSKIRDPVKQLESTIRSLESQIESTRKNAEQAEADLAGAYENPDPAISFDEGINFVLGDSLIMVGGIHEGDREPLTFVKKEAEYCAITPSGNNASYIEIAPADFVAQSSEPEPPVAVSLPTQFSDVPDGAYYVEPVKWAVDKGVTKGVSETNFAPDDICSRGQVATFLWRAKGCPEPATTENPFTDVDPSSAFYKAILWAAESGITAGTSDTTFSPGNPCTRAHVVTFLWRTLDKPQASGESPLADSFPPGYYTDAVRWADAAGLLSGTGEAFAPSALCPRADIVTYLYRVLA